MITFLLALPSGKEYSSRKSNPISSAVYLYLSRSAFLVSFKDPTEQLLNAKSVLKLLIEDLVYQKYIGLLFFRDRNIIFIKQSP